MGTPCAHAALLVGAWHFPKLCRPDGRDPGSDPESAEMHRAIRDRNTRTTDSRGALQTDRRSRVGDSGVSRRMVNALRVRNTGADHVRSKGSRTTRVTAIENGTPDYLRTRYSGARGRASPKGPGDAPLVGSSTSSWLVPWARRERHRQAIRVSRRTQTAGVRSSGRRHIRHAGRAWRRAQLI